MVQLRGGRKVYANNDQMYKTTMCKFFISGTCQKGSNCKHAHSAEELRSRPNLTKTSLCRKMLNDGECDNPNCSYAHAKDELRSTGAFFKSKPCKFFVSGGTCAFGDQCRYAHTSQEAAQVSADLGNAGGIPVSPSGARDQLNSIRPPTYYPSSPNSTVIGSPSGSPSALQLSANALHETPQLGGHRVATDSNSRRALEDTIQKYIHISKCELSGISDNFHAQVYAADFGAPLLVPLD
eukprot:gnl/MRDRNA2_/MRDRNA2_119474_c0_seq1.p1 gnl/MRDRNA2_/MRDRNA2_119474_c0~~gnl/MRDRNA2_/MRDRNA2_119474_c0_seq1.p1  ORF type:complete len:238 (-),score=35.35 gnl/MRDRNA2_/MRDRNA2_119474_c0_seq1:171-884(-)